MEKSFVVALLGLSLSASAAAVIAGWKPVDGLTEAQTAQMTEAAIQDYLAYDEDGEVCGAEEIWHLEREKDLIADRPQRGEIFAVTAFAKGPDLQCSVTRTFDCRVVFNRPPNATEWKVEYTDCEVAGPGRDDD